MLGIIIGKWSSATSNGVGTWQTEMVGCPTSHAIFCAYSCNEAITEHEFLGFGAFNGFFHFWADLLLGI